jgi:predicted RNA-binding Zn ribbon-like protein
MTTDWKDGFLFVGNQLALDFLNTRPVIDSSPVELLADPPALARWTAAAGLALPAQAARLATAWSTPRGRAGLEALLRFREGLRLAVLRMESGMPPPAAFVAEVNRLLRDYPRLEEIVPAASGLERRVVFSPRSPHDLFRPLADAAAALLTTPARARLRKCRNCVLHFLDTSKKGTRVWCSMSLCGNRAKAAAWAGRRRATGLR